MKWTEEQQKVIDLRERNILVSAAAGSGKTAVLVERIISMISDKSHPVDIDHLLIVTFTKAAAGEMRERIMTAINRKREEYPDDLHIERQMTLIHNAQITTIDSFCQYIIRNYFHILGLDPGFRVADEGELKLLKSDVVQALLEKKYQEKEEEFLGFVEYFAPGKNDRELEDLIFSLYHFSVSYPWPLKWLQECKAAYQVDTLEELLDTKWMQCLTRSLKLSLTDLKEAIEAARTIALTEDGPYMYEEALSQDGAMIERLLKAENYLEYSEAFHQMEKYARLSSKKDASVSERKKDEIKRIREQVKKNIKGLKEQYFYESPVQILSDIRASRSVMEVLLDLVCEFTEQFNMKKREKNLVDFSDLEHFALNILVTEENGEAVCTQTARELAKFYEEILIDEYQDSNLVQELILTSISKKCMGQNNLFMVGDVKQSIYRFRLARPELFMEKYEAYPTTDAPCQRIDLHKNFRSRSQVLSGVNYIFHQIMAKYLGNIEYNEETALYPGAVFLEEGTKGFSETELILVDLDSTDEFVEDVEENSRELEARAVGNRIREIVGTELVLDKETGTLRPAKYSDIVILLRTITGWADKFSEILQTQGIPAHTGSQTGYFSTVEIQTILSLLKILDNPRQEIPMAAVLSSPIVGLTTQELAEIKSRNPMYPFYEASKRYADENEKLARFFEMLEQFRALIPFTPMHELLWRILDDTGYGHYAAAMPGGIQRMANLKMLVEKAMNYEATSYRGLFNFIRYIENLQKYQVDFGEANTAGEQENTVRIMSIHKSKGLEFPVVFVSGLGKSFNQQDSRSKLVIHPKLGVGCDYMDPVLRVKTPTLLKKTIQRETSDENLGEELRVLYVALTRAKEKLILTGAATKLEDKVSKWAQILNRQEIKMPYTQLGHAASCLDWVVPAILRHPSSRRFLEKYEIEVEKECALVNEDSSFWIKVCLVKELVQQEAVRELELQISKEDLLRRMEAVKFSQDQSVQEKKSEDGGNDSDFIAKRDFEKRMEREYPYRKNAGIHGKITVSEIKRYSQSLDNEHTQPVFTENESVPVIPAFMTGEQKTTGAVKGSAYHKLLEDITFVGEADTWGRLQNEVQQFINSGKITEEEASLVDLRKIEKLTKSSLGKRMAKAQDSGNLYREQQFVLGVEASSIKEEWDREEMVLVQGIIDAYFYEDDQIVLVDYKTDYVPDQKPEILLKKYKVQLDTYGKALEQLTGKRVKEKILYSFWLGRELEVSR